MTTQIENNKRGLFKLTFEHCPDYGMLRVVNREEINENYFLEKIKLDIAAYIKSAKKITENRKYGFQQWFEFPDGFRVSAGHVNAKGREGHSHLQDDSNPFDFGRDRVQTINYLKDSLSYDDYLKVLSHLSGEKIEFSHY
jgi:hypothetical protein